MLQISTSQRKYFRMKIGEIKKIINEADEDLIRDYVIQWAEANADFAEFMTQKLCPSIDEIDFADELARVIRKNTSFIDSRHYERKVVDWYAILVNLIEPWSADATSFTTERLQELIEAIITEVAMYIDEEDFMGDDWYGDDYSIQIGDIMEHLGNLTGLLALRENVTNDALRSLRSLIVKAKRTDIITRYIGSPYDNMLQLIDIRLESDDLTCALFDIMIKANYNGKAGEWVCRKVDFLRSMGLIQEALELIEANIVYPEVCLKLLNELTAEGKWREAVALLDKAHAIKGDKFYWSGEPNWLEMKYELLQEHGDKQAQISSLTELFYQHWEEKYYHQLKEIVPQDEWKDFYPKLLKFDDDKGYLSYAAPFLIEEHEFERLYQLVKKQFEIYPRSYETVVSYAGVLRDSHGKDIEGMLVTSFSLYAQSRYAPKGKVDKYDYSNFCKALSKLSEMGYAREQRELVEFFSREYARRRTLLNELRKIILQD